MEEEAKSQALRPAQMRWWAKDNIKTGGGQWKKCGCRGGKQHALKK